MKKVLVLEKRGMDFNYRDSLESRVSDLENFRLFTRIDYKHYIEIMTHETDGVVLTYIDCCTKQNGIYKDNRKKSGVLNKPTKEAVLKFINEKFDKPYTDISIK